MQIYGPMNIHGPQPVNSPHRRLEPAPPESTGGAGGADQLDISYEADQVSRLREVPDIRHNRVAEIRAQIEAGTYETSEKLDIALDRILDELG